MEDAAPINLQLFWDGECYRLPAGLVIKDFVVDGVHLGYEVHEDSGLWKKGQLVQVLTKEHDGVTAVHICSQQWLFDRQDLVRERQVDYQLLSEDEYHKVIIFYANVIQAIGEQLKIKQQVIATATVYFRRFYVRNSLKSIDPLLLAPTCLYLASKVEEFGVISNSRFVSVCQGVIKNKYSFAFTQEFPYRINNIFECEFYLLEMMDCCLIVYHPYRPLVQYCQDLGASMDKKDPALQESLLLLAWKTINDTLRTDVCLLYPPYLIALACLNIACITLQKDFKQWFAELAIDMEKLLEVVKSILNLYDLWKTYDEKKEIPVLLSKVPKPKSPPR